MSAYIIGNHRFVANGKYEVLQYIRYRLQLHYLQLKDIVIDKPTMLDGIIYIEVFINILYKVYYLNNKEVASFFIAAKKLEQVQSVGCGDVFGSAFFYNYIRNHDVRLSLQQAIYNSELFVAGKF